MKHGTRIWEKKLTRTATHRLSLLANMMGQLITHEQIETTLAKAQFVKHEMEKVINLAKRGTNRDWAVVKSKLNATDTTVPKLMLLIANRYQAQKGGYVRIIKNGFNAPGSDRAPLAILELVNNKNDIVYNLAKKTGPAVLSQLKAVEDQIYNKKVVVLRDLYTGEEKSVEKLSMRHENSVKTKIRVQRAIHKKIVRFDKSLLQFPIAREIDAKSLKRLSRMEGERLANRSVDIADSPKTIAVSSLDTPLKVGRIKSTSKVIEEERKESQSEMPDSSPKKNTEEREEEKKPIPKSFFQRFFGGR